MKFLSRLIVLGGTVATVGWSASVPDGHDGKVMLAGDWVPRDPSSIDFDKLPLVPSRHVVISDVRDRGGDRVHQHAYLAWHDGRFWAMWSDGPGLRNPKLTPEQHRNIVPGHDRPGTRVSYSLSVDGETWSAPRDLSGPPRVAGFGWIARGFWVRDGELLALASHFNAPGYSGKGLSLEAFRREKDRWVPHGTVLDDTLNNFPPKRLPDGKWMMTRRDHRRQVSVMVGGVAAYNDWRLHPLASYDGGGRPEEPYWYVLPDGRHIVGLIRDNGGSKRLLRTFSADNGRTWSPLVRTDFPDATSKFFALRTSRGYHVLVSNANPRRRDPLTIAVSADGLVYTRLFRLVGGRHVDYPHVIERAGKLLVAFSGAKQTMEVLTVALDDLERLTMPDSVARISGPTAERPWIDLGDEGASLFLRATLMTPKRGQSAALSLATAGGEKRVTVAVDQEGRLRGRLYRHELVGTRLQPERAYTLWLRVRSHRSQPDELWVNARLAGAGDGFDPTSTGGWAVVNREGASDANLARVIMSGSADFSDVHVGSDATAMVRVPESANRP